jgi:hypothetical protein
MDLGGVAIVGATQVTVPVGKEGSPPTWLPMIHPALKIGLSAAAGTVRPQLTACGEIVGRLVSLESMPRSNRKFGGPNP